MVYDGWIELPSTWFSAGTYTPKYSISIGFTWDEAS